MREILFRGKRIDNDEWVYGSFCKDALEQERGLCGVDGFIRLYDKAQGKMQMHEVDRETVGQYTGLTDKNGKKIFEGDILLYGGIQKVVVSFEYGQFVINHFAINLLRSRNAESEIIGNIHDNSEMLEGDGGGK